MDAIGVTERGERLLRRPCLLQVAHAGQMSKTARGQTQVAGRADVVDAAVQTALEGIHEARPVHPRTPVAAPVVGDAGAAGVLRDLVDRDSG